MQAGSFQVHPDAICAFGAHYHADLPDVPMLDRKHSEGPNVASPVQIALALQLICRSAISMIPGHAGSRACQQRSFANERASKRMRHNNKQEP
jgi:hypothetical protein